MIWFYKGKPLLFPPEGTHSFVYLITNLASGKKYIGKKSIYSHKTEVIPGRVKKKKTVRESNWKNYWGSCQPLKEDVKLLGKEKFHREILDFCTSKSWATYKEAMYQFEYGVLLSDEWYNGWIDCTVNQCNLK
jgi:hypothetical protein